MALRLLTLIENAAVWLACLSLLVMGGIVATSVLGRELFNAPVPDDLLMIGLLMVCVIMLPLAYVERGNGHIVVTVIADRLPGRLQAVLSAFGRLLFGLFLGTMGVIIAWKVPSEFAQKLYYDGRLEVPTWPMKAVFVVATAIFLLRLLVNIAADLRRAVRRAAPTGSS